MQTSTKYDQAIAIWISGTLVVYHPSASVHLFDGSGHWENELMFDDAYMVKQHTRYVMLSW